MIPGGGGLNHIKYDNNKKAKRNRRQSYIRKMNERWRTEYEMYNVDSENSSSVNRDSKIISKTSSTTPQNCHGKSGFAPMQKM
jgi:hypothetical protein